MCGLAGFIGKSNNQDLSFKIITNLFLNSQIRGIDACGFFACANNEIYYHKQKGKSQNLVESKTWKDLYFLELDLMLVHTRKTSSNSGSSENNINNHPFVLNNSALIHNGIIHDYYKLKEFVSTNSNCDSEILLNYLSEYTEDYFLDRLEKIKELLFFIRNSEFAFCLADKINNSKSLWMVRNDKRTLYLINCKKDLNQYFFVSTIEIWQDSISHIKNINKFLPNYSIIELPDFSVVNIYFENNQFKENYFNYNTFDFEEKKLLI